MKRSTPCFSDVALAVAGGVNTVDNEALFRLRLKEFKRRD